MLTGASGLRTRPTTIQKIWQRRELNPSPLSLQPGTLATRQHRGRKENSTNYEIPYYAAFSILLTHFFFRFCGTNNHISTSYYFQGFDIVTIWGTNVIFIHT
jgi:hypothetical protein